MAQSPAPQQSQSDGQVISIFAQDPKYTPLDWEFLATLGVTVIKISAERIQQDGLYEPYGGPDAVKLITPSSLV
ncbi:hypothetical protein LTR36_009781 [Oleoguttula mirabilis]|uniref:Uncharacterized protein n=1 Tax=Oleoguttula mirabilis TaxID=1507867 RepID=A0AAV9J6U4_9PEZI|nr:hypothetical protein LTR36_009781 [Oleoguttula mirabilis]